MFSITYDNKDFIRIMESLATICAELTLEINDEGAKIRNISANTEVAITIDMDKDDHKEFEYKGKNSTFMTIPFGEFLKAMKKIKVPIIFTEDSKSEVLFKSGKVKYLLKLLDEDADVYANHDTIMKKYTKDNSTLVKVLSGDMMGIADQLGFADGMSVKIENKKMYFESLSGNLTAGYEIDVEVPDKFEWTSAFSMVYMNLLAKLAVYTKEIKLHVKNPDDPDGDALPIIVEIDVGVNSSIKIVMGALDDNANAPGISVDIEDDESDDSDLDFEEDMEVFEEDE